MPSGTMFRESRTQYPAMSYCRTMSQIKESTQGKAFAGNFALN